MAMAVGRKRVDLPGLADVPPLQLVHRSDLYRALHDRAVAGGVAVEYGKRLVDVQEIMAGITSRFADGSTASAAILVWHVAKSPSGQTAAVSLRPAPTGAGATFRASF